MLATNCLLCFVRESVYRKSMTIAAWPSEENEVHLSSCPSSLVVRFLPNVWWIPHIFGAPSWVLRFRDRKGRYIQSIVDSGPQHAGERNESFHQKNLSFRRLLDVKKNVFTCGLAYWKLVGKLYKYEEMCLVYKYGRILFIVRVWANSCLLYCEGVGHVRLWQHVSWPPCPSVASL